MATNKTNKVTSLATAFRTAASQVTKEDIPGAEHNIRQANFPLAKTVHTGNMVRQGQVNGFGGMGGGNTNYTAPQMYSPFLTPSAFQIPNNRKEVYLWADWFANNEPKVAAGIEFYTDFPITGFELECANGYVKDYFERLVKDLNFSKWLPLISYEYHLRGDVFIMMSIKCEHCNGSNIDRDTEEECKHDGATWRSISILNPDQVDITPHFLDQEPSYMLLPDDMMVKIVMEKKPQKLYDSIPVNIRQQIISKQPIELSPISITHLKRGTSAYNPYGVSIVKRLFQTLAYKDKLRQAQWLIAERHIIPIKVVKVGSDLRPASEEDLENMQDLLTQVAQDPLLTLVTHNNFDFDFVGANGKFPELTSNFEQIDQDIIDGMMLNKAIINGDGPSYSNAQVGLITMAKRLDKFRTELSQWIEERVFKPIAEWNGFTSEGKRGQEELIYPTIKWGDLELRNDSQKLQIMQSAQEKGVISAQTFIEAMEIDYDQEVERLRMEQLANMVNSPTIATGGMGAGYAGGGAVPPAGGGGGGGMSGGGGMPPAGGDAGGDVMGGEGAPPGGEAPVSPAAIANNRKPDENYRFAANIIADIFNERSPESSNSKFASKKYASSAHEHFLKSTIPVHGRGYGSKLPIGSNESVDLISFVPIGGGEDVIPLNMSATIELNNLVAQGKMISNAKIRIAAARGDKDQNIPKMLFSKLEQRLYSIVLQGNMPYPFFAQYTAGPSMQYQLDGAIPSLKLGIEADSQTFHSSPEKQESDKQRDMQLATQGWIILRFREDEIDEKPQEVLSTIMATIKKIAGGTGTSSAGAITI